jgi:hypothetical protein
MQKILQFFLELLQIVGGNLGTLQGMRIGVWRWDCGFVIYGPRSDDVGAVRCWLLSIEMETRRGRYARENTGRVEIGQAENSSIIGSIFEPSIKNRIRKEHWQVS